MQIANVLIQLHVVIEENSIVMSAEPTLYSTKYLFQSLNTKCKERYA